MTNRHQVFVSYHHNDQSYKDRFETIMRDHMISGSVEIGDISDDLKTETIRQRIRDEYLRDCSVTVVLVGNNTWQRKHVDWEISSSIRKTELNPRMGLIGILLPNYTLLDPRNFDPYTIPPRLYDNFKCDYVKMYTWSEKVNQIQEWIHEAYNRKSRVNPDNSRDLFRKNRTGSRWFD